MRGWKLNFLPDLVIPGEIPPGMGLFKQQQYRWNFGYAQVMKKLTFRLWRARNLSLPKRFFGTFQLAANLNHISGLLIFILSVPLAILHPKQPSSLGLISIATSGPSILFAAAQLFGYRDPLPKKVLRLFYLPMLVCLTIGTSITNSQAVLSALSGHKAEFIRTPKFNIQAKINNPSIKKTVSNHSIDIWLELILAVYLAVGLGIAFQNAPELVPLTALGMFSFGFVGFTELVETKGWQVERKHRKFGQTNIQEQE
jgi:hypothetical protein